MSSFTKAVGAVWSAFFEFIKWFGEWISQPLILIVVLVVGGTILVGQDQIREIVNLIADAIARMVPSL